MRMHFNIALHDQYFRCCKSRSLPNICMNIYLFCRIIIIIIMMVIFKCYFSGELIALSYIKKQQQQRCEHRIIKNKQIKSTVHDGNIKNK